MIKLPLGIDSFEKLRTEGCYYIDKTQIIKELLENSFEVNLITRPRRFGKTLTMSMLEDFFDIRKESRERFLGLEVLKDTNLCENWMNQWPVLFVTFKSVEGRDFENAYGMLKVLMSDLCKKHFYLEESKLVDRDDIECFRKLKSRSGKEEDVKDCLNLLMRMMKTHFKKPVILLIDEYDVPLAKASEEEYYNEMLDVIRSMLGKALKTNEFLKFAIVTGCLKIAKESIFTGTNNFVSDTISGGRYNEYFGFIEHEVQKLLIDTKFSHHLEEMRKWYDGYHFGLVDVYCPWDVLNHVGALQINPEKLPQNYWEDTSHNGILQRFISREDLDVNDKFEILMEGGFIVETIIENLTYDMLKSSEENLWSLLYLTGYLTCAKLDKWNRKEYGKEQVPLIIPNEEVKAIFQTAIIGWFKEAVKVMDRKDLFYALWNGDVNKSEELLSNLLFETISYHDYKESYYHAFLAGIFSGAGYIVESNYEHGNGRPDIVVMDKKKRRVLIIEIKHSNLEMNIESSCNEAVKQIIDKRYSIGLQRGYHSVISYGVAFYKKECRIKSICQ